MAARGDGPPPNPCKRRLLLVDDEAQVRWAIGRILDVAQFVVETASNGKEAQASMESATYDLLVTDVQMPLVDGLSLLSWVDQNHPHIYSVAVTAHGSPSVRDMALDRGAILFLEKPFNTKLLVSVLNHYCSLGARKAPGPQLMDALAEAVSSGLGGEVLVRAGTKVGRVHLVEDKIVWARVSTAQRTLNDDLINEAGLGKEDLTEVYAHCRAQGKNFAATLVTEGLVDEELMGDILLRWIARCVADMSSWRGAQSLFAPEERVFRGALQYSLEEVLSAVRRDSGDDM